MPRGKAVLFRCSTCWLLWTAKECLFIKSQWFREREDPVSMLLLMMRCFQLLLISALLLVPVAVCVAGRSSAPPISRPWGSQLQQRHQSSCNNPIFAFIRGGSDEQAQQEESADEDEDDDDHVDEEDEESWGEDAVPVLEEGEEVVAEEEEEEANIEVQPFMEETPSSEDALTPQGEEWVNNSNNDEDEEAESMQQQQEEAPSFPPDVVADDPSIDDDSSAFVDRMELADAYDEGETTSGEIEADASSTTSVPVAEADDADDDEVIVLEGKGEPEDAAKDLSPLKVDTQQAPVVDKEMMRVLVKELRYRRREVNAMKHDIVAMVAAKRLYRPMEGIPSHWFRNDDAPKPFEAAIKVITRVVISVAAGSLALWVVKTQQDSDFEYTELFSPPVISSVAEPVASVPASDAAGSTATSNAAAYGTQEEEKETATSPAVTPEESVKPVNEHVGSLGDPHPHSIKPGHFPQDELDVTWLDKGITAVENMIKSFLRMEL